MSKNRLATKTKLDNDEGVKFTFSDGRELVAKIAELPQAILAKLAVHGLSQKCGDSYAGAANPGEAFESVTTVLGDLLAGNWSTSRVGAGGVKLLVIVEALARVSGETIESCQELWGSMSEDDQAKTKKHPAIKAAIAQINAERAAERAKKATEAAASSPAFTL